MKNADLIRLIGWIFLLFSWINLLIPYKNKRLKFHVGLASAIFALGIFFILLNSL